VIGSGCRRALESLKLQGEDEEDEEEEEDDDEVAEGLLRVGMYEIWHSERSLSLCVGGEERKQVQPSKSADGLGSSLNA